MHNRYLLLFAAIAGPLFLLLSGCRNPTDGTDHPFEAQNKLLFELPPDIDADLYRMSVITAEGDSVVYFENARSKSVEIAVPASDSSFVKVYAYKNGRLVYSGAASVESGRQISATLIKYPATPAAPVLSVSGQTITVDWTLQQDAELYKIFRSFNPAGEPELIGSAQNPPYVDIAAVSGVEVRYLIIAQNPAGESHPSPYTAIAIPPTVTGTAVPDTPGNLVATAQSSKTIQITFDMVSGASGYKLYWSTDSSSFEEIDLFTLSYTHSNLSARTTYFYKVTALRQDGESEESEVVSAATASAWVVVISGACNGCGHCASVCRTGALVRTGRRYVVDPLKCDGDGACLNACGALRAMSLQPRD